MHEKNKKKTLWSGYIIETIILILIILYSGKIGSSGDIDISGFFMLILFMIICFIVSFISSFFTKNYKEKMKYAFLGVIVILLINVFYDIFFVSEGIIPTLSTIVLTTLLLLIATILGALLNISIFAIINLVKEKT